ncbi:MAG TPA: YdeI/OmpD-associated family protein [Thermoanaerobaculia bacterium]|jgi:uncharacterized protein YdeI (YjbR/CyaY-like superfamily)
MPKTNPAFDAYIEKAAPFARPILEKLRKAFHAADPEIEEVMKWGAPHFDHNGIVGSMAAFKEHVRWGFWKARLMKDPHGILDPIGDTSMSGAKVKTVKELPPDKVLREYIREAVQLNLDQVKVPRPKREARPPAEVPDDLAGELKKNKKAREVFDAFPPSHRHEYIAWITEAKQPATRQKRLAQAIEWMAEGKQRNWKYVK